MRPLSRCCKAEIEFHRNSIICELCKRPCYIDYYTDDNKEKELQYMLEL